MPPTFSGNAGFPPSHEMEVGRGSRKALDRDPELCPTDSDSIAPKRDPKKVEKQSLDYALRTGLAGGLAGCAVSLGPHLLFAGHGSRTL